MKAALLLPLLLSVMPALAGFTPQQARQSVKLAYGQNAATLTFRTMDGSRITKARPLCDCTTVRTEGSSLVAEVDTSAFDASVDKQIEVATSDGRKATLTMHFEVPAAVIISPAALVWERGAAPTAQEFRIRLPKGSPVRALLAADLSGDAFDYTARTLSPGREYAISVTPRSTERRCLNRLIIRMDGPDPRYTLRVLYLRVR